MLRFVKSAVQTSSRLSQVAKLAVPASRNFSIRHRDGWLEVEETGRGTFQNIVSDGRHVTLADEPGNIDGGLDSGMNPYGFLLSGLGACTSMTVRMYARKKDIPLEKVRVLLKHDRIWAKDCNHCQSEKGRVDVIDVDVQLIGEKLTDDDRANLMKIANSCPVHQTLCSETVVKIAEVDDDLEHVLREHKKKAMEP
eukprot:m.98908 g.98908  ORF g.98908 m.98908 type:complete len:196 (-) comp9024_c2_seq2:73-660(-)